MLGRIVSIIGFRSSKIVGQLMGEEDKRIKSPAIRINPGGTGSGRYN